MNQTQIEMTEEESAVLMRNDFFSFVVGAFNELHPGEELSDARHLRLVAANVDDWLMGRGNGRHILNLAPRSLKSFIVSVAGPAWCLGNDPTTEIICASYGQDLADKHARDCRTLMQSAFYKDLFPETRLSSSRLAVNDFATTRGGFRMATSVGGVLTGRGARIIIIDDPSKPDEILSLTKRTAVNEWFDNSLFSRLNNKEHGIIIIAMQRLHQDDLVGHLTERGGWNVLSLPAIAGEDEEIKFETILGVENYARKQGEVLDPTRESIATLRHIEISIGQYNFASQYQQNPMPEGGNIVLREWLQRYDPDGSLPKFPFKFQSWDTANKSGELNDYSVCTTWGVYREKFYLLDVFRKRLNYPELKQAIADQILKHRPVHLYIEDKASGTQLIQELKGAGEYRIRAYCPPSGMDKIMRLHAQTHMFESGKVLLPTSAPWLIDYERELLAFPGSKHCDQVDSTTQALFCGAKYSVNDVWRKGAEN